ncbi:DUF3307 domain-containing protein [Enterovibrio baiacu]|uniref:DUF3307 domain-containing protein n=1 Tax=Enterovibrio baiacu TaxID=2491023 RepID=UPI003D10A3A3
MILTVFLVMVAIHLFVEFYVIPEDGAGPRFLRTPSGEENKKKTLNRRLIMSVLCQSVLMLIALLFFTQTFLYAFGAALFIGLFAFMIDVWGVERVVTLRSLVIKQSAHLALLLFVATAIVSPDARSDAISALQQQSWWGLFCGILAYLLAMKPSSVAISLLLRNWTQELNDASDTEKNRPLKDAGTYIGYFERALIVTFVLWGQLPGVALVLAAKSVFRFGDMKDHGSRMFTEYVMLGTFASALFAIASAMLGLYLIAL